ncbi:hypothetical protein VKT23_003423 [Stygiomarasmius scandens]|uniref:F-box protein n=1 Tax=Marasmiellus scandens TaxID=2682957 RepID=A0ABR1JYL9_9AGAR
MNKMRGSNGLLLNDDIVDHILMFCPSFSTLHSAMLTSKSFYKVYKAHPQSLLNAVAQNLAGPAYPEALKVVRFRVSNYAEFRSKEFRVDDFLIRNGGKGSKSENENLTTDEARLVTENAKVVNRLEDLFSFRHKDRKFQTSRLTPTESYRFRRAMYRVMLFCRVFYFGLVPFLDWLGLDEEGRLDFDPDEVDPEVISRILLARRVFLKQFDSEDLVQIYAVYRFLLELVRWVDLGNNSVTLDYPDYVIYYGPEKVLECVDGYTLNVFDDSDDECEYAGDADIPKAMVENYLSLPIYEILRERGKIAPSDSSSVWSSILDLVEGEHDVCDQCKTVTGFDLLGPSTYDFLSRSSGIIAPKHLLNFLKGNLMYSPVEVDFFNAQMDVDGSPYARIVRAIFEDGIRRPGFEDWKQEDQLCEKCMEKLLREHLYLWLLSIKKKSGELISEDCCYGYDCQTMMQKLSHAQKFNHLCIPTKEQEDVWEMPNWL